jgi:hypothetical protein
LFYGGLAGALGAGITTYFYAMKKGVENTTWKPCSIIIILFIFPTVVLPILLIPSIPLSGKIGIAIVLTLFAAVRFYATTKGQEAVAKIREREKKHKMKEVLGNLSG